MNRIWNFCMRIARRHYEMLGQQGVLREARARILDTIRTSTPDNPTLFGYKVYSQSDEDGIVSHIFSKIGEGQRTFVEIGCSDGLENNTHALLMKNWRGVWVDADTNKIKSIRGALPSNRRLTIHHAFVTPENAAAIIADGLLLVSASEIDFLSVDIDGDDAGVALAAIRAHTPRVLCVEYNAKFPPPIKVAALQTARGWTGDDYHGASLQELVDSFQPLGYRLVCCNSSGVNAFFVIERECNNFPESSIDELYRPAAYDLRMIRSGHPPSLKFLSKMLQTNG